MNGSSPLSLSRSRSRSLSRNWTGTKSDFCLGHERDGYPPSRDAMAWPAPCMRFSKAPVASRRPSLPQSHRTNAQQRRKAERIALFESERTKSFAVLELLHAKVGNKVSVRRVRTSGFMRDLSAILQGNKGAWCLIMMATTDNWTYMNVIAAAERTQGKGYREPTRDGSFFSSDV